MVSKVEGMDGLYVCNNFSSDKNYISYNRLTADHHSTSKQIWIS